MRLEGHVITHTSRLLSFIRVAYVAAHGVRYHDTESGRIRLCHAGRGKLRNLVQVRSMQTWISKEFIEPASIVRCL